MIDRGREGRESPAAGDGHDIVVRIEVNCLIFAEVPSCEEIVSRIRIPWRENVVYLLIGHFKDLGFQAQPFEIRFQKLDALTVAVSRGIDGRKSDEAPKKFHHCVLIGGKIIVKRGTHRSLRHRIFKLVVHAARNGLPDPCQWNARTETDQSDVGFNAAAATEHRPPSQGCNRTMEGGAPSPPHICNIARYSDSFERSKMPEVH